MSAAAPAFALSRTCNLSDFPGVITVAGWQQAMAHYAWARWIDTFHILTREQVVCDNYSGAPFLAPGPSALYRELGRKENGALPHPVPAVFGLCVVDRVEAPVKYLQSAAALLRENGLLFLTFTFWDAEGEDVAGGHEDRLRIYDARSWNKLIAEGRRAGLRPFGAIDWRYYGDRLDDHSLASLVLTKTLTDRGVTNGL